MLHMIKLKGGEYTLNKSKAGYLGGGAFGKVYRGTHVPSGKAIAVKIIEKYLFKKHGEKLVTCIENEIKTLQKITKVKTPYIIEILDNFSDSDNIYILTELCNGGSLEDKLKKGEKLSDEGI